MNSEKEAKMAHRGLMDDLSDEILSSILSFLPINEVARTSIISRQWEHLWKYVTRLEFDLTHRKPLQLRSSDDSRMYLTPQTLEDKHNYDDDDLGGVRVPSVIDYVLRSVKNKDIEFCHIEHKREDVNNGALARWIKYLKRKKKIREISLNLVGCVYGIRFPTKIFKGANLRIVDLGGYDLRHAHDLNCFLGCTNLETLNLRAVTLANRSLDKILSYCGSLKNLCFGKCVWHGNFMIHHEKLKNLEISEMHVADFHLVAENLMSLLLDDVLCTTVVDIYCPKIEVLLVRSMTASKTRLILETCSGLIGKFSMKMENPFENLIEFHTTLDLNSLRDMIILSHMLRVCRNLQSLHITTREVEESLMENHSPFLLYPESTFWERTEIPDSITHRLKKVIIKGFRGNEREVKFIVYLVSMATKLNKMEIHFDKMSPKEAFVAEKHIMRIPRSSLDVTIKCIISVDPLMS